MASPTTNSMETSGKSPQSDSNIRSFTNTIVSLYQRNKAIVISLFCVALGASIYFNPQAFLNLWLTRDQQGVMLIKQNKPEKAALTFSEPKWVAYSFYASGNFEQAASLFSQFEGVEYKFAQANALAHIGQYFKAVKLYQEILTIEPNNQATIDNLALMNKIIKKLKKRPGKKALTGEIDPNLKVNHVKKKSDGKPQIQSSKLWLEQVQQNPSKFLRKKFQQEHQNDGK
ncbi:MAG: hypothetical protein ACPGTQ_03680 [Colwellia sp.]